MSLGIPIKQEPVSEESSTNEEPPPWYNDFTLFGAGNPENVEEFMSVFDNTSPMYAPVPGGHATQHTIEFP